MESTLEFLNSSVSNMLLWFDLQLISWKRWNGKTEWDRRWAIFFFVALRYQISQVKSCELYWLVLLVQIYQFTLRFAKSSRFYVFRVQFFKLMYNYKIQVTLVHSPLAAVWSESSGSILEAVYFIFLSVDDAGNPFL